MAIDKKMTTSEAARRIQTEVTRLGVLLDALDDLRAGEVPGVGTRYQRLSDISSLLFRAQGQLLHARHIADQMVQDEKE